MDLSLTLGADAGDLRAAMTVALECAVACGSSRLACESADECAAVVEHYLALRIEGLTVGFVGSTVTLAYSVC